MAVGEGGGELVKQLLNDTGYRLSGRGCGASDRKTCAVCGAAGCGAGYHRCCVQKRLRQNKVMEFVGPGVAALSTDFRNSVDVMTTETTCLSSVWQTDEEVHNWLALHGRGRLPPT